MNAIKNRIVFFTTLFIWIIFYYFILDISSFNPESWHYDAMFLYALSMDIFLIFMLPTIIMLTYAFLTFNKDDHSIFMDNLEEMLEENHRKELQKKAAIAIYKSVSPEDEGDEKNQSLEEEQEESLSLWEWYDCFICRFHYRKALSTNYNFDEYIELKPVLEKDLEKERLQILGCIIISRIITHLAVLLGYLLTIIMWLEIGYLGLLFPIGLWLVSIIFMWLLIYVLRHLIFIIGI